MFPSTTHYDIFDVLEYGDVRKIIKESLGYVVEYVPVQVHMIVIRHGFLYEGETFEINLN